MSQIAEVFSSGGGTQSCAIAALIVQGKLPKPNFAVIVDTSKERNSTWEYMDKWVYPALKSVGVELHRAYKTDWAKETEYDLQGKHLLIPAFTNQTGEPGKLSGFCSDKWKKRVRDRFLRSLGVRKSRIWIGFSLDEMPRVIRMMRGEQYKSGLIRFPLIDDVPMKRHESIKLCEDMGWGTPPRSNCWMCPNQSDDEWLDLKENSPEEFQKAVELEREIQSKDPFAWLHKSCTPLSEAALNPADATSRPCDSGTCFL